MFANNLVADELDPYGVCLLPLNLAVLNRGAL